MEMLAFDKNAKFSLESPHPQFLCYYHEFVLNFCLETEKPSRKTRKRKRKRKTHNTHLGFLVKKIGIVAIKCF